MSAATTAHLTRAVEQHAIGGLNSAQGPTSLADMRHGTTLPVRSRRRVEDNGPWSSVVAALRDDARSKRDDDCGSAHLGSEMCVATVAVLQ